ncbi:MAG: prephenate dehydrogenase/arogenate dehydrogenase family protein [Vicinamibacterales bacterium]
MAELPRTVAIVGHGLIGGSIALALDALASPPMVITVDQDEDLGKTAGADLVVLAAPISENLRILSLIPGHLSAGTLITDTGSAKAGIVAAAAQLPPHVRFIGGHPMAGAAAAGRLAARPDLFAGRRWILTPDSQSRQADLAGLCALVEAIGAVPHVMDAAEHDRLIAFVSHLPQLTISALMHVAGEAAGESGLQLAGSGLHDSTRLAASPAPLWREIVGSNRTNIDAALDELIAALQRMRNDEGTDRLESIFTSAARWKERLG